MAYDYQTPVKTEIKATDESNINSRKLNKNQNLYRTDDLLIINWDEYVIHLKYIHFPCPFANTLKGRLAIKSTRRVFV